MLRSYFTIALRQLWKNKFYSSLNVTGLLAGVVCFTLITIYVDHELGYDRFHSKRERIYRLAIGALDKNTMSSCVTGGVMPSVLKEEYAGIESYARFRHLPSLVAVGDKSFFEQAFFYSDSSVFDVFSFRLISGDPITALRDPFSIVLTVSAASKYFDEQDPIGRLIQVDETMTFKVTGVMEDVSPNSHLHFDMLASATSLTQHPQPNVRTWQLTSWYSHYFHNYILLEENADPAAVDGAIRDAAKYHSNQEHYESFGKNMGLFLQPLTNIHLNPIFGEIEPQGDEKILVVLGGVAALILVLACVNFANLNIMLSLGRRREVGLRKTLGARKSQVWGQFTGESFIVCLCAFAASLAAALAVLPWFNTFTGKNISLADTLSGNVILAGAIALIVTTLSGGLLPALAAGRLNPAQILKANIATGRSFGIRKGIIILQFSISIVLIGGSLVIWRQVEYMLTKDLGLSADHVIVIPTHGDPRVNEKLDLFHQQLDAIPSVLGYTIAESIPGEPVFGIVGIFEGHPIKNYSTMGIGYDYLRTFGMELVAGRDFSREIPTDTSTNTVIINEALCKLLGWKPEEAIGKSYNMGSEVVRPGKVVGVVRDFHFNSLRKEIRPIVMSYIPFFFQQVPVKIRSDGIQSTLASIKDAWKTVYPTRPFDFRFANETLHGQYQSEQRFGSLISYFSILAILIGLLGLVGMVSLDMAMRTKEIGIRKVLGASITSLVARLSRGFLSLIVASAIISIPLSIWLCNMWLADFAYKVDSVLLLVISPALAIIVLAAAVLSLQTARTASANPVNSLRTE